MEMDRQTIMVLFGAILGLALFGSVYLSSKPARHHERPTYSVNDVRYKFQQQQLKDKNKKPAAEPIISTESEDDDSDVDTSDDSGVEEGTEEGS